MKALLDRSLKTFAGVWESTGNGNGAVTPTRPTTQTTVNPVIDWTEIDTPREQHTISAIGASAQKASWLQRFLLHMGTDDARHHDHGIEVVLSGKKK